MGLRPTTITTCLWSSSTYTFETNNGRHNGREIERLNQDVASILQTEGERVKSKLALSLSLAAGN